MPKNLAMDAQTFTDRYITEWITHQLHSSFVDKLVGSIIQELLIHASIPSVNPARLEKLTLIQTAVIVSVQLLYDCNKT